VTAYDPPSNLVPCTAIPESQMRSSQRRHTLMIAAATQLLCHAVAEQALRTHQLLRCCPASRAARRPSGAARRREGTRTWTVASRSCPRPLGRPRRPRASARRRRRTRPGRGRSPPRPRRCASRGICLSCRCLRKLSKLCAAQSKCDKLSRLSPSGALTPSDDQAFTSLCYAITHSTAERKGGL